MNFVRMFVSDGTWVLPALLDTKKSHFIENNQLKKFSIFKLTNFEVEIVQSRLFLFYLFYFIF
jgi:hypothetical protein